MTCFYSLVMRFDGVLQAFLALAGARGPGNDAMTEVNYSLMRLLLTVDALRGESPHRLTVIMPCAWSKVAPGSCFDAFSATSCS